MKVTAIYFETEKEAERLSATLRDMGIGVMVLPMPNPMRMAARPTYAVYALVPRAGLVGAIRGAICQEFPESDMSTDLMVELRENRALCGGGL